MKLSKLTTEQFKSRLQEICDKINDTHQGNGYIFEFGDNGNDCRVYPKSNLPFYTHYLDVFMALESLYDCAMWFEVYMGKPCLRIFRD